MGRVQIDRTPESNMRNQNLDSLRGIAALWVLLYHLQARMGGELTPFSAINAALGQGWLGVDLFVVISGFVISKVIDDGWAHAASTYAFTWRFSIHRFGRIAPLHYLTALIMLGLAAPNSVPSEAVWANFLFVQNLSSATYDALNGPAWTIGLEMQWYLIAPFIVLAARHHSTGLVVGLALGIACAWYCFVFAATGPYDGNVPAIMQIVRWHTQLPGMIFHFLTGWFVYRFSRQNKVVPSPLWGILSVVAIIVLMHNIQMAGTAGRTEFFYAYVFGRPVAAMAFGLLLAAVIGRSSPVWVWPVSMAGTISFGIYLWHSVIFRALDVYGLTIDPVLVILLVISISVVSWYLLEQPMIKTSKRLCP